jgi:hypothetical protein
MEYSSSVGGYRIANKYKSTLPSKQMAQHGHLPRHLNSLTLIYEVLKQARSESIARPSEIRHRLTNAEIQDMLVEVASPVSATVEDQTDDVCYTTDHF